MLCLPADTRETRRFSPPRSHPTSHCPDHRTFRVLAAGCRSRPCRWPWLAARHRQGAPSSMRRAPLVLLVVLVALATQRGAAQAASAAAATAAAASAAPPTAAGAAAAAATAATISASAPQTAAAAAPPPPPYAYIAFVNDVHDRLEEEEPLTATPCSPSERVRPGQAAQLLCATSVHPPPATTFAAHTHIDDACRDKGRGPLRRRLAAHQQHGQRAAPAGGQGARRLLLP